MLKITHRLFLIVATGFLLLACAAFHIQAQQRPPDGRVRRSAPTPTPTPTPQPPPRRGRVISDIKQGPKVPVTEGIYGAIRWRKEYGLPSTDGGQTPNKALNCTAFRVGGTVQEGTPGTFGQTRSVGYWAVQSEPTEENGYYICRYSVTDSNPLPHNRAITVSAYLGPFAGAELNQALITGAWFGASQPQPPPGYQRVLIGGRGITLTDSAPRVTVDFEMVYRSVPAPPR